MVEPQANNNAFWQPTTLTYDHGAQPGIKGFLFFMGGGGEGKPQGLGFSCGTGAS